MTYKEITDLIKLVNKTQLSEVRLKQKDSEIVIRTSNYHKGGGTTQVVTQAAPVIAAAPAAPVAAVPANAPEVAAPAKENAPADDSNLIEVKSPIVGTFYRASSPDKPPYKKVGDRVEVGDVVCIVEAMKLFNEIESEVSGTIVKVLVEDAQPVEYDQVMFLVDPS